MSLFVARAGVWVHESPPGGPCRRCTTLGAVHVSETESGRREGPWCSLACWGRDHDRRALIVGAPATAAGPLAGHDWPVIAAQYPAQGPAGIASPSLKRPDVLLYRDTTGALRGVLWHWRRQLDVIVDPDHRRRGIGRALVRAAGRRWVIDLGTQAVTEAGAGLTAASLPRP